MSLGAGVAYVAGKKNQVPRGLQKKRVDHRVNRWLTAEATGFLERSAGKPFFPCDWRGDEHAGSFEAD